MTPLPPDVPTPTRYVRVATPKRPRGFFLQVTRDTAQTLTGIEVRRDGEEVVPPGYHLRVCIIEKAALRGLREYRMSRRYGTLAPSDSFPANPQGENRG